MSLQSLLGKSLAFVVATLVFCQTSVLGTVLCTHTDGSQRFENPFELADCHGTIPETAAAVGASTHCIDRTLTIEVVTGRSERFSDLHHALLPFLLTGPGGGHASVVCASTPRSIIAPPRAFLSEQHARIISSTIILT